MPIDSKRVQAVFLAAVEHDERTAILDRECGDDLELRRRVEALLKASDEPASYLDEPAVERPAGTIDYAPITEKPGTMIGPYKLKEQIGEGGFGLVFVAEQQEPVKRKVALKVIKPGMDTREVMARFTAERQALALMDHPNIARVLDAGATDSGRPYFVMELVRGIPITDYCDQNQSSPRERLDLFVTVCQAVQHAHQKGIIHRDIKPTNVLVTSHDGKPVAKVIDFGVAKAIHQQLTDRSIYTNFAQMIGTPLYMSPEQAEMSGLDIDTRSDIYSLGVLLYELLTGTTPLDKRRFAKAAYDEIRRMIREEEPQKPSTRLSTSDSIASIAAQRHIEPAKLSKLIRGDLDWITMKALEKDRTRRYETANGLARDIQRYLNDEPVEACPPTFRYRLRKAARKHRTLLSTATAFLVLLVGGAAISTWQAIRARAAEQQAREQSVAAEEQRRLAQEKEVAAMREADKARALAGMMQELLGAADPSAAKGGDYTVRQLVDDFEAGLGERLADQPEVEADLRTTIGQAYRYLMLNDKAEQQHRRALDLRRRVFGPEHPKVAQSMTQIAWTVRFQNNFPAAEKQAREAVAILRRFDDHYDDLAAALRILSHTTQGKRPAEGEAQLREALALAERAAGGRPTPMVADISHELASHMVIHFQGRAAEALPIATRSVAVHRVVHGDKHPETMHGWRVLSFCHLALGQLPEAERDLREALAISRRAYGNQPHRLAVRTMTDLVAVLDAQFQDEAANAILQDCLAAWQKKELSFTEADTLHGQRAFVRLNRGDYTAAVEHLQRALDARRKSGSSIVDPTGILLQFALGGVLFLQDKPVEARAALQGLVLPARLATLKSNLPSDMHAAFAFALAVGGSGKPDELQAALTHAQLAAEKANPAIPDARRQAKWVTALVHHRSGNTERAIEALREAQSLFPPRVATGMQLELFGRREVGALLVRCLSEKGDHAAAEIVLRDGLKALQAGLPSHHPEIATAQLNLAAFLASQKQFADAEPLLLAAHESLKSHPQAPTSASLKQRLTQVRERLVRLYDDWGKPAEAAQWQRELEDGKTPSGQSGKK